MSDGHNLLQDNNLSIIAAMGTAICHIPAWFNMGGRAGSRTSLRGGGGRVGIIQGGGQSPRKGKSVGISKLTSKTPSAVGENPNPYPQTGSATGKNDHLTKFLQVLVV